MGGVVCRLRTEPRLRHPEVTGVEMLVPDLTQINLLV